MLSKGIASGKGSFRGRFEGEIRETVDPDTIFDSQVKRIHRVQKGNFSMCCESSSTIAEYAAQIWNVAPCRVS